MQLLALAVRGTGEAVSKPRKQENQILTPVIFTIRVWDGRNQGFDQLQSVAFRATGYSVPPSRHGHYSSRVGTRKTACVHELITATFKLRTPRALCPIR